MIKYSIIVPIYNAEKYLEKCINSLINQTYKNIEIILVNDGSTDSSLSICDKYDKNNSNVRLYDIENQGVSSARNFGISKVTGDYVLFVDSDDYLEKNAIEIINENISDRDIDLIKFLEYKERYGKIIRSNICMNEGIIYSNDYNKELFKNIFQTYCFSKVTNLVIKKSLLENKAFNKDIGYGEDFIFCLDLISSSKNILILKKYLYYYLVNDDSITNSKNIEKLVSNLNNSIFVYNELHKYRLKWSLDENGYEEMIAERFFKELNHCLNKMILYMSFSDLKKILLNIKNNEYVMYNYNILKKQDINIKWIMSNKYRTYFIFNVSKAYAKDVLKKLLLKCYK